MVSEDSSVFNYMSLSPVFIFEKSSILNALDIMKNYGAENIPVIKEDFSIIGILTKRDIFRMINSDHDIQKLKNKRISDLFHEYNMPVVLYQRMTVTEAYSIMKCLGVNGLPVVELPWEKKIIGFLWKDDIEHVAEKNYMKISV